MKSNAIFTFVRRLRVVTFLSNFKNYRWLKRNESLYKKYGIHRKFWEPLSYSAISKHSDDIPWLDKDCESNAIKANRKFYSFSPEQQKQILQWKDNGYMILKGFFDKQRIEAVEKSILPSIPKKKHPAYFNNRILNLFESNKEVEGIFKDPSLLKILSFILGKEVLPFQTINFYKSSSQPAHSDFLHLTTEPQGYLIAVWVALEDIQPGCGEFMYYPGSHKLPYLMNNDFHHNNTNWKIDSMHDVKYEDKIAEEIKKNHLKMEVFSPKKGDIIIWHANMLHGSIPVTRTGLTRKSLVMHYFAKDVLCYHESIEKPAIIKAS